MKKITIHDVACAAGVSAATVSRSLNLPDQVKPAVRAHVIATAERLGYLADGAARALASRRSGAVGAIVPTLDNPIFATCIAALQQRLDEHGRVLLIASSGYDPAREARDLRGLLERGVDGVMLVGADHAAAVWHLLASARVPVVVTWTTTGAPPGVPCIGFDNQAATRRLVSYLLDIGHRRIAMIAGPSPGNDRATARVAGVREGLARAGIDWPEEYRVERPYSVAAGRATLIEFMSMPRPPTAIICGNDHLAFGALAAAAGMGIRVPAELSLTGFDDLDFAAHATPALTTVHVPAAAMGRQAADCLVAAASARAGPASVELEAPVMLRDTTAPPPPIR